MKKIGIITYHFARNYGAVLQCFALQFILEKQGHEVEILNFVSDRQLNNNDYIKHGGVKSVIKNICLLPFIKDRKIKNGKFDIFCDSWLNLSIRLRSINEMKEYIKSNQFDVLISGSDQVFNPNIDDFNDAFMLPFEFEGIKASYAASTGNALAEDLVKYSNEIAQFDYLSIREKNDLTKFKELDTNCITVTCDPVMLLDIKEWENLFKKAHDTDYMICYFLHKDLFDEEFELATQIAKRLGLRMLVINARYSWRSFDTNVISTAGPYDFLNLIANASYVCTDSFHGSLFSLIFKKSFSCFDSRQNINDSRRKNLLEIVGAEEALQYIEDKCRIVNGLDYDSITKNIETLRNNSIQYLEKIVD